jgi:hypothetical protein
LQASLPTSFDEIAQAEVICPLLIDCNDPISAITRKLCATAWCVH